MPYRNRSRNSGSSSSTRLLLLLLGVAVGVTTLLYGFSWESRSGAGSSDTAPVQFVQKPPRKCWVFNHLNKAGGSTIKYMLQPWVDEREDVTVGLYDSAQWIKGERYAHEFLAEENALTWGAYVEGLRPHGGGDECKWFTIFRHPISRLVSAYYYCLKGAVDGLCASNILRANETDLHGFAEHWGNFGLRQFSLAYALPENVLNAELENNNRCKPVKGKKDCASWYRLKLYLEDLHLKGEAATTAAGGSLLLRSPQTPPATPATMKDGAMMELLQPVTELLNGQYAAVGIMEEWKASIRLFQAALDLPNFDWAKASHKMGKKNSNSVLKEQEKEALVKAWTDPELKKHLLLDLVLYDHAVSVHKQQIAQYGL